MIVVVYLVVAFAMYIYLEFEDIVKVDEPVGKSPRIVKLALSIIWPWILVSLITDWVWKGRG